MLSTFSYAYWPSVYLLWRIVLYPFLIPFIFLLLKSGIFKWGKFHFTTINQRFSFISFYLALNLESFTQNITPSHPFTDIVQTPYFPPNLFLPLSLLPTVCCHSFGGNSLDGFLTGTEPRAKVLSLNYKTTPSALHTFWTRKPHLPPLFLVLTSLLLTVPWTYQAFQLRAFALPFPLPGLLLPQYPHGSLPHILQVLT